VDELAQVLEVFELDEAQTARYRELHSSGPLPGGDSEVDRALISAGLAEPHSAGIATTSLRLAIELRAASARDRFDSAREAASELHTEMYRRAGAGSFEVVHGREAASLTFNRLQLEARSLVRSFDRGPYFGPISQVTLSPVQEQVSARGVTYQTIIEQRSLESSDLRNMIREGLALGEQLRVVSVLPMRISIVDDRIGLLVLPKLPVEASVGVPHFNNPDALKAMLVYESTFLDGLISMFTSYWDLGLPAHFTDPEVEPDVDDRSFLRLLASGLTDSAIAHELEVSPRTVQRRLNQLCHRFGVSSRFQLGVQVARRGLLDLHD